MRKSFFVWPAFPYLNFVHYKTFPIKLKRSLVHNNGTMFNWEYDNRNIKHIKKFWTRAGPQKPFYNIFESTIYNLEFRLQQTSES